MSSASCQTFKDLLNPSTTVRFLLIRVLERINKHLVDYNMSSPINSTSALAKQGNPKAIGIIISQKLQSENITVKVTYKKKCLQIMLEATHTPDSKLIIPSVITTVRSLNLPSVRCLRIVGRKLGEKQPAWTEHINFASQKTNSIKTPEQSQPVASRRGNGCIVSSLLLIGTAAIIGLGVIYLKVRLSEKLQPRLTATSALQSTVQIHINQVTKKTQLILKRIMRKYGYSRFIDRWGPGGQGLFLPAAAWNSLSFEDQQVLIHYAQVQGLTGIIVGRQTSRNVITLDETVWEP